MNPKTRKAIEKYIKEWPNTSENLWLHECLDEIEQLREAVSWYGEIAASVQHYLTKPFQLAAVEAVLTELSLDNGQRAKAALTESQEDGQDH